MKPLVTIGLPVYNGAEFLDQAIESILAQSYSGLELIISDNASTDATPEICQAWAARDSRVVFRRQSTNRGVVANSNCVFDGARGEFFRWASHDDFIAPHHVESCVEALLQHPQAVVAYTQTVLLKDGQQYLHEEGLRLDSTDPVARLWHCIVSMRKCNLPYGLIRSAALRQTRLFAPYIGSDIDLMLELSLYGTFVEVPEPLFFRRLHPDSASQQTERQLWQHYFPGQHARARWRLRKHLARAAAVHRSPLSLQAKARAWAVIARNCYWEQMDMIRHWLLGATQAGLGLPATVGQAKPLEEPIAWDDALARPRLERTTVTCHGPAEHHPAPCHF